MTILDTKICGGRGIYFADSGDGACFPYGVFSVLSEGDDSGTMMDLMKNDDLPSPEESMMTDSLRQEIERSLDMLNAREADVIRLYFGLAGNQPHTLEEIGQKFELTRERVRQIKEKAIRRMKHAGRSRVLRAYLG